MPEAADRRAIGPDARGARRDVRWRADASDRVPGGLRRADPCERGRAAHGCAERDRRASDDVHHGLASSHARGFTVWVATVAPSSWRPQPQPPHDRRSWPNR